MRIIIIGSRGFIGSHLTTFFKLKEGNEITGCDIKVDDQDKHYFQVDKMHPDYSKIFKDTQYDVCIYAGGNGSVPYSIERPDVDFHLNTLLVDLLLENIKAFQHNCKFVHISSAAVYGSVESLPITEASEVKPMSPYGWNKYLAEIICKKYYSLYNVPTISLRVFSVYGEGLRKQLFWDMHQKLEKSNEITLYGTGNESRDFIYISDLINAFDILINKSKFQGEVYNVASGIENSIKEAAEIFANKKDSTIKIVFGGETKAGDPINWRADISKINKLGFTAQVNLELGLQNYTKWLKENA